MDGLLLISITFLSSLFCIIIGFVLKLYFDERNLEVKRHTTIQSMGLNDKKFESNSSTHASTSASSQTTSNHRTDNEYADNSESEEETTADGSAFTPEQKIGKKKLAKLQAKGEARALREQEQVEREERKRRDEIRQKEEENMRTKLEEEDRKMEESRKLIREERERREHEQYIQLKKSFQLEEQGFDENFDENGFGKLAEQFIKFVKSAKVVHIDELASHFRLKPNDVINTLNSLVLEKSITGVFDDRGKFIYVSESELNAVAKYINQRGRVSLQELIEYSNRLISLETISG